MIYNSCTNHDLLSYFILFGLITVPVLVFVFAPIIFIAAASVSNGEASVVFVPVFEFVFASTIFIAAASVSNGEASVAGLTCRAT